MLLNQAQIHEDSYVVVSSCSLEGNCWRGAITALLPSLQPMPAAIAARLSGSRAQVDMEERFCQKVKQLGCTCVTISHRPALMAFHDIVLALDGEGGWSLHRGARGLHSEEGHSEQPAGDA